MTLSGAVLSFAVVAGLLTVIPGLDTALVLRAAVTQGRKQAFATALGISTGALMWGAAAALGVSALLTASGIAYAVLRVAGSAYLIWLGATMLWRACRHGGGADRSSSAAAVQPASSWRSWQRGLLTNVLNPKIGAFYVAVLPQFIPAHTPHLAVGLLLATVHDVEGMLWFTVIICGAHSVRRRLSGRLVQLAIDGTTGAVLLGFGLKLSLDTARAS